MTQRSNTTQKKHTLSYESLPVAWEVAHVEKNILDSFQPDSVKKIAKKLGWFGLMQAPFIPLMNHFDRREYAKNARQRAEETEKIIADWMEIQSDPKVQDLYRKIFLNMKSKNPNAASAVQTFAQLEGYDAYKYSGNTSWAHKAERSDDDRTPTREKAYFAAAAALATGVHDGHEQRIMLIENGYLEGGFKNLAPLKAVYELAGIAKAIQASPDLDVPDYLIDSRKDFSLPTNLGFSLRESHYHYSDSGGLLFATNIFAATREISIRMIPDQTT